MGKIAVVLICFSRMFAQSYPCCPRTFGTALVFHNDWLALIQKFDTKFCSRCQRCHIGTGMPYLHIFVEDIVALLGVMTDKWV